MKLTSVDHKILNAYIPVLEGLADYLSSCYEIVLHSLEDYEHSVICIFHGEHTGRTVGAPITDLALKMLEAIEEGHGDHISYFSRNRKGEPLKSTTIAIRGEGRKIIGLLCINLYLGSSINDFLAALTPTRTEEFSGNVSEFFAQDTSELILAALEEEKQRVLSDENISPAKSNKLIVEGLYNRGIFQIKDAVITVAEQLDISKNTVYMHLRNCKSSPK